MSQSISFSKQWAEAHQHSASIDGVVANFVLSVLNTGGLDANRLAAIQRSFEPIDDDGTLRMEVDRSDVVALLNEVLMLRAAALSVPMLPAESTKDEVPCDPIAQIAAESVPSLEPESTEPTVSDTSDAGTAPTVRPVSKSTKRR